MKRASLVFVLAVSISACGGGGGGSGSSCGFIAGNTGCNAPVGGCEDTAASSDSDLGTFATVVSELAGTSISAVRGLGAATFPSGSNAGVFLTPPGVFDAAAVTLTTLLDQENTIVESATGPALTVTATGGDPATNYVSFVTTAPFNGLRLTVNESGSESYFVYEFCGAAEVH